MLLTPAKADGTFVEKTQSELLSTRQQKQKQLKLLEQFHEIKIPNYSFMEWMDEFKVAIVMVMILIHHEDRKEVKQYGNRKHRC